MKLLLTGFEPFGSSNVNPSELVVQAMAQEPPDGVELATTILPVDGVRCPRQLISAFQRHRPEAVLCLGEAGRRMSISIERVFVNLMDYRIADNAGNIFTDRPIVPNGPAAYFSTLPVRALQQAIQAAGIPAQLSLSAGAFLCNQVSYQLLHYLTMNDINIPAGFIHLPALPEQVVDRPTPRPSMSLDSMVTAIRAAVDALVKHKRD